MPRFDEARLDDEQALARSDAQLRSLAESGARVRRAALEAAEDAAVARSFAADLDRPRAVVVLGPERDLVRAVLETVTGTPVIAWRALSGQPELPGWVGASDLVVLLAPQGAPDAVASAQASAAVRRGCQVVAVCPPASPVADHTAGRWSSVLTTTSGEPFVLALLALEHLGAVGLGPATDLEAVAAALDAVAVAASPYRQTTTNPAKQAAVGLAESVPLVTGRVSGALTARAVEQAGLLLRRSTGLAVVAGDLAAVRPVLEAATPRTVFDDPYDDPTATAVPSLLLVGDDPAGASAPDAPDALALRELADGRGVRVVTLDGPADTPLASHAAALLHTAYVAAYLALGAVTD